MLYFYLTHQHAKILDVTFENYEEIERIHWIDHWCMTRVELPEKSFDVGVFMNDETKYCFLVKCPKGESVDAAIEHFLDRLERYSGYNLRERFEKIGKFENTSSFNQNCMTQLVRIVLENADKLLENSDIDDFERVEYVWNAHKVNNKWPVDFFMDLLQDGVDFPHKDTSVSFLKVVK